MPHTRAWSVFLNLRLDRRRIHMQYGDPKVAVNKTVARLSFSPLRSDQAGHTQSDQCQCARLGNSGNIPTVKGTRIILAGGEVRVLITIGLNRQQRGAYQQQQHSHKCFHNRHSSLLVGLQGLQLDIPASITRLSVEMSHCRLFAHAIYSGLVCQFHIRQPMVHIYVVQACSQGFHCTKVQMAASANTGERREVPYKLNFTQQKS